jgi:dTDP-4-amino-4,6-dideoxygalactose transaminase
MFGLAHDRDTSKRDHNDATCFHEVVRPGFKYNMTDLQAAIGLHQLRNLNTFYRRRKEIAAQYNQAFSQFEHFELPAEREDV